MPNVQHLTRRIRETSGHTLVEVMAAIIILTILFAISIPVFFGSNKRSEKAAAKAVATQYARAIEQFQKDHGGRSPNFLQLTPPGCTPIFAVCEWVDTNAGLVPEASAGPLDLEGKPYLESVPELIGSGKIIIRAGTTSPNTQPQAWWDANPKVDGYIRYYRQ